MLKKELLKTGILTEEELDKIAGIPSTAVDRMVFAADRDGRDGIDVGNTFELVIEKEQLVDPDAEPIKDAEYADNLDKYLERKLCVVNGGHTMSAYIARQMGYDIIQDYFMVPENKQLTRDIMLQAGTFIEKNMVLHMKIWLIILTLPSDAGLHQVSKIPLSGLLKLRSGSWIRKTVW